MSKGLTAIQRQRWRFARLVAVARSAYQDEQGELATWALQAAWLAAEDQAQFDDVVAGAQFMLDHPIDGIDQAILEDLVNYPVRMEITLSA
jgi:hypothetical protein